MDEIEAVVVGAGRQAEWRALAMAGHGSSSSKSVRRVRHRRAAEVIHGGSLSKAVEGGRLRRGREAPL